MEKLSKLVTLTLTTLLAVAIFIPLTSSSVPPIPMTIDGYVLIQKVDETIITAPAGFAVYAKEDTAIINVNDPNEKWITDSNGYYMLGASASQDNVPIDLWVENINVTRIIFQQGTFLTLNLTVIDTTAPTIEIISPTPGETLPQNQPAWINATLTDNFALDTTTITLTLNQTELTPTYNTETGLLYCQTSPLAAGHYSVSLSVGDLAGNLATETWNFTVTEEVPPEPPTVAIISPTAASPAYTQSDQTVQVAYQYTEMSPKNATIRVYNSTHTITTRTITDLVGGTNIQRTDVVPIPAETAEGAYNLEVTIFNIHDLSATANQTNAIIIDNTAPSISNPYQDPPGQVVQPGETVEVEVGYNVTVTVNVTEPNLESVSLWYNISATEWTEIQMNPAGNQYTATIPSSGFEQYTRICYYIVAVDKAGNTAQTPVAGVYFETNIIPEFTVLTIIVTLLAFTIAATAKGRKEPAHNPYPLFF